jgi:NADH dehydrogenase (ubiquinone) 1 alpha subcomplex subunit 9
LYFNLIILIIVGACGTRVYVPFRGCEMEPRHLKPMFDLGQLGLMPFSPRDEESIRESMRNSDVVINMIGKHYETKHIVPTRRADGTLSRVNYDFEEVHSTIPQTIARLAKEEGVRSFIHMSALSADLESQSNWSRTKAQGEVAVKQEFPEATIVKCATVFGPEDRFLNWIAEATDRLPFFPLIDNGSALVQPVHAVDVGLGLKAIVDNHVKYHGKTFQFCGTSEYTYKEVCEFVSDVTTVKKPLIDIPVSIGNIAGRFFERTISPFLTPDMIAQLQEDVIEKENLGYLGLKDLDIEPVSMDKMAFDYLHRFRPGGHFLIAEGYH